MRLGIQAVYFILLARTLGPKEFGAFAAVVALVGILAPFSSWGTGNLLVRSVARDHQQFPRWWGTALATTLTSGALLAALTLAVTRALLPPGVPWLLVVAVALADLLFARLLDVSGQAFQAFERLRRTAQLQALGSAARLAGVAALLLPFVPNTATAWGAVYLACSVVPALFGAWLVRRELGWGPLTLRPLLPELREGFYFALGLSAQSTYSELSKTMLARLASLQAAGVYTAASRIVDVAFVPVRSLLYAAYARLFKTGEAGMRRALAWAARLALWAAAYGVLATALVWVLAPFVPLLLGREYAGTVAILRWLSPLIFVRSLHYFAADTLSSTGNQGRRSLIQVGVAVLNVLLNFWLIPQYSWLGAAWAALISEGALALALWGTALFLYNREEPLPSRT